MDNPTFVIGTEGTVALAGTIRDANKISPRAILERQKRPILFSVLVVTLGIVAWPFAKFHMQAIAVLRQASGQEVPPIFVRMVTESVRTEDVQFPTAAGVVRARLYLPVR